MLACALGAARVGLRALVLHTAADDTPTLRRLLSGAQAHAATCSDASAGRAAAALLSRVHVARANDVHKAVAALDAVRCDTASAAPALVVLDDASSLLTPLLGGVATGQAAPGAESAERARGHALLVALARALVALATERSTAVVVLNHVVRGCAPALGRSWRHVAAERVLLLRDSAAPDTAVCATLVRSSSSRVAHSVRFELGAAFVAPLCGEPWPSV